MQRERVSVCVCALGEEIVKRERERVQSAVRALSYFPTPQLAHAGIKFFRGLL
jgi:hypothetical protein